MSHRRFRSIGLAALLVLLVSTGAAPEFAVTFTRDVRPEPISARLYVFLKSGELRIGPKADPRFGPDWFRPQPFFAVDTKDWRPGSTWTLSPDTPGYPDRLDTLPPGDYAAQAVVRLNPDTHRLGDGEGNAFGPIVKFKVDSKGVETSPIALTVDTIVPPRPFHETDRLKLVERESPRLSAFYGRPIKQLAAVILPEGYADDPRQKRGTLYIIPGFGGDHFVAERMLKEPSMRSRAGFGDRLIRVVLDPDCGTGHHVFADSATNGPRGQALVEEFIPYIETTFHADPSPKTRLLTGHSSGGWSSLWLQVAHPDDFGGVWSSSPDPVDFRDFQKIDLYAQGENMFVDRAGERRPIARMGTRAVLYYDKFSKMEDVIGDGGQLHSFEAVFSPLGRDGRPRRLWDRASGAIDHEVARAWEAYDIRLVLERHWDTLGPKLAGKLHVVVGDLDTFYLEGAVGLLKAALKNLGSDASIEIIPNRDHANVIDPAVAKRFDQEMTETLTRAAK